MAIKNALLYAYDAGAKVALEPIAKFFGIAIADSLPQGANNRFSALILSTSTSKEGLAKDIEMCRWAQLANIQVVALEDYPGNASILVKLSIVDILIVESEPWVRHYVRLGFNASCIKVTPSPRYDKYRGINHKKIKWLRTPRTMLWAGQPEKGMCTAALGWLAPWAKKNGITIYFRAHPRDENYHNGYWANWFKKRGLRWVDCTSWKQEDLWSGSIGLVATAFSSLALDALFHGIPVIHIAHLRAVKTLLLEQKSTVSPGICILGAAAQTYGPYTAQIASKCLSVGNIRSIERAFGRHYRGSGPAMEGLIHILQTIIHK